MRIIFPNANGGISIIHPTGLLPVAEVAKKDVPAGVPYLIVHDQDIPEDRTYRNAWSANFAEPHGYGMGAEAWFAAQEGSE